MSESEVKICDTCPVVSASNPDTVASWVQTNQDRTAAEMTSTEGMSLTDADIAVRCHFRNRLNLCEPEN